MWKCPTENKFPFRNKMLSFNSGLLQMKQSERSCLILGTILYVMTCLKGWSNGYFHFLKHIGFLCRHFEFVKWKPAGEAAPHKNVPLPWIYIWRKRLQLGSNMWLHMNCLIWCNLTTRGNFTKCWTTSCQPIESENNFCENRKSIVMRFHNGCDLRHLAILPNHKKA